MVLGRFKTGYSTLCMTYEDYENSQKKEELVLEIVEEENWQIS